MKSLDVMKQIFWSACSFVFTRRLIFLLCILPPLELQRHEHPQKLLTTACLLICIHNPLNPYSYFTETLIDCSLLVHCWCPKTLLLQHCGSLRLQKESYSCYEPLRARTRDAPDTLMGTGRGRNVHWCQVVIDDVDANECFNKHSKTALGAARIRIGLRMMGRKRAPTALAVFASRTFAQRPARPAITVWVSNETYHWMTRPLRLLTANVYLKPCLYDIDSYTESFIVTYLLHQSNAHCRYIYNFFNFRWLVCLSQVCKGDPYESTNNFFGWRKSTSWDYLTIQTKDSGA